jgi:serine/threonine-protein kinase SRPK3
MHIYNQVLSEESTNYYLPGRYHLVHLGDIFHDGTYEVMHKLGFGGYSTVWLVKDKK